MASPVPLQTQCIGRMLIDMPLNGKRSYSQSLNIAKVERLDIQTAGEFWNLVESKRQTYISQSHRKVPNRLAHYEQIGKNAAMIFYYDNNVSLIGANLERFLILDNETSYRFFSRSVAGDHEKQFPSPELFKPYIDKYTPVLSRLVPRPHNRIPAGEGFCIDGAIMLAGAGRKNDRAGFNIEIYPRLRVSAGYIENNTGEQDTPFDLLRRKQQASEEMRKFIPKNEPLLDKEIAVLQKRELTLAGLTGQEIIVRTTLNNGRVDYIFRWIIPGGAALTEPRIAIGISTKESDKDANGNPYPPLPPEEELLDLWYAILKSFKPRPGALPGNADIKSSTPSRIPTARVGEPCPKTGMWRSAQLAGWKDHFVVAGHLMPGHSYEENRGPGGIVWQFVSEIKSS